MKKFIYPLFFLISHLSVGQVLWFENFDDEPNGATSGNATGSPGASWSTSYAGGGTFSKEDIFIVGEIFVGSSLGGNEGVWSTNVIDISAYGYAVIDLTTYSLFVDNDGDYFEASYILNNSGIEIPFFSQSGSLIGTGGSAIVSGSQLQVIIRMYNDDGGDSWGIEDLTVTGINTLYSTDQGGTSAWDQGTTWSSVAIGGPVAGVTPNILTRVIIGSGYSINIPSASAAIYLEIQTGGALTWSVASDLDIGRGGISIQNGASISSGGSTTAQIDLDQAYAIPLIVDGTLTIGDLDINGNSTITVTGGGNISIVDELLIGADASIDNNLTGAFDVANRISFETGADADFINDGPLTAGSINFNTDNSLFNNSSTAVISGDITSTDNGDDDNQIINMAGATLSLVNFNPANADFDVFNSGTLNQSGNFINIANGDTNFDNLTSGIWNWSLAPNNAYDITMNSVLNCSATDNTFNYNASGGQRIVPVTYHHLLLSNSGVKDANNASWAVNGNWTVSGSATFNEGTGTITLGGSGTTAQTITSPAGETFYNLTIDNTSSAHIVFDDPVTVTNTLTMTSGIVNLSGNDFVLGSLGIASSLTRTVSTVTNWMYGGSFTRHWLAGTAVSSSIGNLYGLIPIGAPAASSYRPVQVNSTVNPTSNGSFTVTHTPVDGGIDLSPVFNDAGINILRKLLAPFVTAVTGVTGGTYDISVTMTGLLPGTLSDIRLAVSNGTTTATTVGTHAATTGSAPNPTATRTGLTIIDLSNDFRIVTTNTTATPLPVQLLSFTATQVEDKVLFEWSTASEVNNDFFSVERLNKKDEFSKVSVVPGHGTTQEINHYQADDFEPYQGKNYYRLKQTDFDGKFSYSDVIMVEFTGKLNRLDIYPNPSNGSDITLVARKLEPEKGVPVQIVSLMGTEAYRSTLIADENGIINAVISSSQFKSGVYFVRIGGAVPVTKKLIID